MKNQIIIDGKILNSVKISKGKYNCIGYSFKEYFSMSGLKKGLKSHKCPANIDNLYNWYQFNNYSTSYTVTFN